MPKIPPLTASLPRTDNLPLPAELLRVNIGDRLRWAKARTEWFPWGIELVTGPVSMVIAGLLLWRHQEAHSTFHEFLKSATWFDFAIPLAAGFVVAFVLTPTAGFTKNLLVARPSILTDRLTNVWRDNVHMAGMVDAFQHKQEEMYALLSKVLEEGRMLQRGTYKHHKYGLNYGWWNGEYEKWIQNALGPLQRVLPAYEWDELTKPVNPVAPNPENPLLPGQLFPLLQQQLSTCLDRIAGLIQTEYRPPNPHFAPPDLKVAGRYLPKGDS
jgi:hypothetical protein